MDAWLAAWQNLPGHISPYLFSLGHFQLRYYSLMYLVAFALTYLLVRYRVKNEGYPYTEETIQDLIVWCIVGLILGARLGYVLFYQLDYYLSRPLEILLPFEFSNGIRFVGSAACPITGAPWVSVVAGLWYCRRSSLSFWNLADLLAPAIPLGYTFGRIGNFINGELYGR
jgi:phosphatidylglycerol:prolipoprotein diacylglycerol transferase